MTFYYRRFIFGFSDIASPLHRLTNKGVRFDWDKNCQRAFGQLKEQLLSAPVLAFPDLNGDYILYCDASDVGVGAVLTQKDENEEEKVVSVASKAFSGAEKKLDNDRKGSICGGLGFAILSPICLRKKSYHIQYCAKVLGFTPFFSFYIKSHI